MPRPSPAVSAALSTSKAISARAAERARRSRSVTGLLVDGFVAACSLVPYAVVALALRLVMARVFFLDGQTRIDGPRLPLDVLDFNFSLVLPAQVRPETFTAFLTQYPPLPIPPVLAAYTVSYAEFVLPILLVLGFATRFAALSLLVMTALISLYVMPQALLSAHIYWAGMLLVLLSQGAGQISVDAVIRYVARR
jgi:putative oxidoreductase